MRSMLVIAVVSGMLMLYAGFTAADPLEEFQQGLRDFDTQVLRATKQPIRHAASVNALVVSLQTDLLGKDSVQAPLDIREISQHTGRVSRQRDSLATAARRVDVFLDSLK